MLSRSCRSLRPCGAVVACLLAYLLIADLSSAAEPPVAGPMWPPHYPDRAAANAAILASDLPVNVRYDLSDETARGFEGEGDAFSTRHYKEGRRSLLWAWNRPAAVLAFDFTEPIAYLPESRSKRQSSPRGSVFMAWVYNEQPAARGVLRVSFGNRATGEEACWFPFGLNFTGWRLICYKYDQMNGTPRDDMDAITMSTNLPQGMLFIDHVRPVVYADVRWQWPDYQTPELAADNRHRVLNQLWINTPTMAALQGKPLAAEQAREIAQIKATVMQRVRASTWKPEWPQAGAWAEQDVANIEAYFAQFAVERDGLSITGLPPSLNDRRGIRTFLDRYLRLAVLCKNGPEADRERLTRLFLLMSEHLLDQGWAEGSALDAQDHFGYKSRAWPPAMLLMEDELREAGLLRPMVMAMIWMGRDFIDFTAPFEQLPEETAEDLAKRLADYLNTLSASHLVTLLLLPDDLAKYQCLQSFTDTYSRLLTLPNASIKADGSFYHHRMHYAGYCLPAMRSVAATVSLLDGTAFEVSEAAYDRLRHTLAMAYVWGYPGYAFNACGRHPLGGSVDRMADTYKVAAQAVPRSDDMDPELANLYAVMTGQELIPGQTAVAPQGYWSLNYHASGILKHGAYTVIAKGHGPGVKPYETYIHNNRFGRYFSHGTLMIFKTGSTNHSGYQQAGWMWSMLPGATTLLLTAEELDPDPERFYGTRMRDVAPFSGSSELDGQAGVFALQLDGGKSLQNLEARKTVFALGDLLVCLGSDLQNGSPEHATITTLVQNGLAGETAPGIASSWQGAYDQSADRREARADTGEAAWLIDSVGAGYLIPAGNDQLIVTLGEQQSLRSNDRSPTAGRFFTAWIDHGKAPQKAGYEYAILLGATPETMTRLATEGAGYTVMEKSRACHAVRFPAREIDAYAFFADDANSAEAMAGQTRFVATDTPSLVIVRHDADGTLAVSVCHPTPDIDRPFDQPAEALTVRLQIRARVTVVESDRDALVVSQTADTTILAVDVSDGMPTRLVLRR